MCVRMHAGARITARLRRQFLRAALHQDVAHYDAHLTSADVVTGLNADCAAVQSAISEKVHGCRRCPAGKPCCTVCALLLHHLHACLSGCVSCAAVRILAATSRTH